MTRPGVRSVLCRNIKRSALSLALGMCVVGGVQAQSAVGSIFGSGQPGSTIAIQSPQTGVSRSITAGADGRFTFSQLPPGKYVITADGVTREVDVKVGSGSQVLLGSDAKTLDRVEVVGVQAFNPIDVSSVESTTVFTAEQMVSLPVASDVSSVALLAPGAVRGDSGLGAGNLASFGGSSVAENGYYINGFDVTNMRTFLSFANIPFQGIGQLQIKTGGYGAEYGRSLGGIVSIVTTTGITAPALNGHRTGALQQARTCASAIPMHRTRCTNTVVMTSSTAPSIRLTPAARSSRTACSSLQWWKAARRRKTTSTR
ncbi:carboxypeptidase regulatory-like domain-containing protein [Xanthomonas campestris pv. raphani]|uniref:TonB-dependent receptor n=1 Tax=Xanthomonas campestris TaxID=339 RepID=UPI002368207B|nr:carboxypeptidase regulatory-like domain-containing protein [Xanthomonas campestris]MEA9824195.1 carboxypeptidase regulatory-like domain-containing protein [Xanthomonas campestris pv. raphani]MEA9852561.1 carboxypeptidase regulatory-like domain-containing protein [Xanthomonas campestris pv. raphani]MEA9856644.1 carboxypeptidase regulatory-like domain-containing protein [Xanthomonas campestris pv. raphani]MEA9965544.1 carboxypeptidase regulatory-like domain-containing protein [Xanthomonas camp